MVFAWLATRFDCATASFPARMPPAVLLLYFQLHGGCRSQDALWTGHAAGINGFATLSGLFMAYFGARFGVLGVYVSSRSREKQAVATGQPVPGVVEKVVKAVTRR